MQCLLDLKSTKDCTIWSMCSISSTIKTNMCCPPIAEVDGSLDHFMNMFKHCSQFDYEHMRDCQQDSNWYLGEWIYKPASETRHFSPNFWRHLIETLYWCTLQLTIDLNKGTNTGGPIYILSKKIEKMFHKKTDTMTALKPIFSYFWKNGLSKIHLKQLPKASTKLMPFRRTFRFFILSEHLKWIHHIYQRCVGGVFTMEAKNLYNSLYTSSKWNASHWWGELQFAGILVGIMLLEK